MKHILLLLTILTFTFSCSSDDSTETEPQNQFPTNISIENSQSLQVGDILTINGNGFSINETYIITFSDNEVATITEINSNYLKVEVPENAVSGNIILTYDNQDEVIGNITIDQSISEFELFASMRNIVAAIEKDTGVQNQIADLGQDISISSLVFDSTSNSIYAVAPFDDNGPVEENGSVASNVMKNFIFLYLQQKRCSKVTVFLKQSYYKLFTSN
ncbi:MAG: IPT/TIG domain-containing protein [Polaribacter sp.]|nr:IPT/TIG domain-containing protein [Polaribacter sp.]